MNSTGEHCHLLEASPALAEDQDPFGEALFAVSSAEEYSAKIIKLQQACLRPLKDDLADWLNKIMSLSSMTADNFMDKLDNGVIICRLAKVISSWCQQQMVKSCSTTGLLEDRDYKHSVLSNHKFLDEISQRQATSHNRQLNQCTQNSVSNLSSSSSNVNSPVSTGHTNGFNNASKLNNIAQEYFLQSSSRNASTGNTMFSSEPARASRQANGAQQATLAGSKLIVMKPSSQSALSLASSSACKATTSTTAVSTTNLANGHSSCNLFLLNLIRMDENKIWEDAKCRTFYARDNVCNFIRWAKEFGVNQSVLFESDDLVLHANPRQVVLCLLDVARIACVKHGFTEAPGLVKFEQEIDRELGAERCLAHKPQLAGGLLASSTSTGSNGGGQPASCDGSTSNRSNLRKGSRSGDATTMSTATDELILRYCKHKKEQAARDKQAAELEASRLAEQAEREAVNALEASLAQSQAATLEDVNMEPEAMPIEAVAAESTTSGLEGQATGTGSCLDGQPIGHNDIDKAQDRIIAADNDVESCTSTSQSKQAAFERVDSLDSGEGRTESASTSHTAANSLDRKDNSPSSIPALIKRSSSCLSVMSSIGTQSELSSSRSSLFSNPDVSSSNKRNHIASDLDGKVMRIAKSYYGKGARRGVTRLSEGKYKIADRIVFVRLLKGHRVMVRIGGGWDTLENFLFRHKSDPSQVIDVDNLLPIESKMTFEKQKNPHQPTTPNRISKLPYYRRSDSASSTNLSVSNSITTTVSTDTSSALATPLRTKANSNLHNDNNIDSFGGASNFYSATNGNRNNESPYLVINRGHKAAIPRNRPFSVARGQSQTNIYVKESGDNGAQQNSDRALARGNTGRVFNEHLKAYGRKLSGSTNLYPATLTTRLASTVIASGQNNSKATSQLGQSKVTSSTTNLHTIRGSKQKQESFNKLGRSNDSLQASTFFKSQIPSRQHGPVALDNSNISNSSVGFKTSPQMNKSNKKAAISNTMSADSRQDRKFESRIARQTFGANSSQANHQ